jgi:uncharacterized lipoprotein
MNAWPKVLFLVVGCLPLAACKLLRIDCHKPGAYVGAVSVAPLKVPPGLDAPDTRSALKIPDLNEPARPRAQSEPCLDEPPRYSPPKPNPPKPQA